MLIEAREHLSEVREYAEQTISQMMTLKESLVDEYERKLYDYTLRGKELISANASLLKGEIRTELESALLKLSKEEQTIETGLQIMELTKKETQAIAQNASVEVHQAVLSKCEYAIKALEAVNGLKADCEYYKTEAQAAAQKACLDAQAAMNLKAEEELEMLRRLRMQLESDREAMNERLNNAWEMLRGEKNGR